MKNQLILFATDDAGNHWKWRYQMAESIAQKVDKEAFGVKAIYLIGSTKNANSGPASDIDLMIHFSGDEEQKKLLQTWIDGWSKCLDSLNHMLTGHHDPRGLIDLHLITDKDIQAADSFTIKIGAHTDAARKLL
ncbi:MAG TPA: nucleotidyltransferase domain-containing protein [Bacteroidales bacterium]|nr:nucleotidyltransferase domain-containing protein [Bacteroidales bacterium]HNZ42452.1 nucleotidyltransferase domain-containing protein [Bacteroidales bacterium]HPB24168.1 nucleotidyltransferase domain-containing protein [Bacteroidales bacterium]HPI29576.1 nucleotidyltransferase domain-containing protein [Bacteroidales bacterium]HQN14765.1 nucleotidyltransferase domain-containing protein [Bacteroidales bacterium]